MAFNFPHEVFARRIRRPEDRALGVIPARPFEKVVVLSENHVLEGRTVMMSIKVCRDHEGATNPCQLILQILPASLPSGTWYRERYGSI